MLAQGEASARERNPGYASGKNTKPRRGDRTLCEFCRPSGASVFFVSCSQGCAGLRPRSTLG